MTSLNLLCGTLHDAVSTDTDTSHERRYNLVLGKSTILYTNNSMLDKAQIVKFFVWIKRHTNLRQGVPNLGAVSGVSGRTQLLPSTPAHALVLLHNTLPTGHETSYDGWTHRGTYVGRWLSVFEALRMRYPTVSEAFLWRRIATQT
jgi:hypothetical protein